MAYKRISPQPVVEGGTGVQANTVYAVLCGGTATTNPIQSIASVGTAGQVLTSNGAGALPTFQAASNSGVAAFSAYKSAASTGVTGAGALYTVICDSEFYDNGSNYNTGTGTFTAPTTGGYQFTVTSNLNNVSAGRITYQYIVTTSTNSFVNQVGSSAFSGLAVLTSTISLQMTAGDICNFKIKGTAAVSNDMDLNGAADGSGGTYFSGFLVY